MHLIYMKYIHYQTYFCVIYIYDLMLIAYTGFMSHASWRSSWRCQELHTTSRAYKRQLGQRLCELGDEARLRVAFHMT